MECSGGKGVMRVGRRRGRGRFVSCGRQKRAKERIRVDGGGGSAR